MFHSHVGAAMRYSLLRSAAVWSLLGWLAVASGSAWAQNVVQAWDPQGYGFYLKKVVSDTAICSGQTFSYTIYFSFPAGTQSATIWDNVPSPLVVHSVSVTSACGTPTVTAPPPGTGGQVQLVYSSGSIPSGGCSGSMTIVVSFPNGVTCNGTSVRNRVCMTATIQTPSGPGMVEFCTPFVITTAQASNPWQIGKQVLNGTWVSGNCPWKVVGDTVTYQICVYKNNPAPCGGYGQLNLVNGVVTDVLPAGAQFISASPSAGVTVSGNTVTWNVGNLSATQPSNIVCVTLKVYYPPAQFPTNSQITNTATLTGQLGSLQQPCGQFQLSSTVCWQKVLPAPPTTQASLFKWGSTNGQPGCAGTYTIQFCNTGNTTLPANSVVIRDTLPATLTLSSASGSSNLTVTTSGNIVTATLNAPLPPNACTYVTVNFTISQSATPNSTITNCAYATVQGLTQPLSSCWSFVVNAPAPNPCVWKEICSPQNSYSLGQVIRMRLRVQNIGGLPITGATITDNLNPNFQYVGNPAFYTSNTWNTPCNSPIGLGGVTAWTPAPNISVSGQTVTISNVNIPASCQSLFWNGCGMYGNNTVPYYWIEFDVKIRDTAGLGNIPNSFTLSGGGVSSPVTSNTVLVLTTGQVGFTLTKEVAPDTSSWASSLTVSPGGTLYYRLRMPLAAGSVPLRHATFVDLLPRDAGTADNRILPNPCQPRGSQFDVTYQAGVLTSHPVNWYTNTATTQASATAISAVTGGPPQIFPTSCGTGTPWTAGVGPGAKNLGIYFTTAVGASLVPTVIFQAKAAQGATPGQIACNSFAAGGAVRHYFNTSTLQDVAVAPLESGNVCIAIDSTSRCYRATLVPPVVPVGQVQGGCKYTVTVTLFNPGTTPLSGVASSPQGTVSPSSFTVPVGSSTLTLSFIDTPPQDNVACIRFGVSKADGTVSQCDSVCFDLPPCPRDTCCPRDVRFDVKCKGKDTAGNQIYHICASGTIPCKATLMVSASEGPLSPSTFSIGPGSFTICTDLTDVPPPASGVVTLYYTVFGNGVVLCRDSVRIQLPECPPPLERCCQLLSPTLQSSIAWWSYTGTVLITGSAAAALPLQRFSATIVSAQRKVIPNILPPPLGTWQRIFGDFVGGSASNPPGALSVLTPFSRELVWGTDCTQQTSPGAFKLWALFPPPPGWKQRDTLRFTVRYSFTDCECRTCDTLVTYTLVRPGKKYPDFPWDLVTVQVLSPGRMALLKLPLRRAVSEDSTITVELTSLHLKGSGRWSLRSRADTRDIISPIPNGYLVVLGPKPPGTLNGDELELELEGELPEQLTVEYRYCMQEPGIDLDCSGMEERTYELGSIREERSGILVQHEGRVDKVKTFSIAIVNTGAANLRSPAVSLQPLPQPDGTVPVIIAQGAPNVANLTIKCTSCCIDHRDGCRCKCFGVFEETVLEPGAVLRPMYITVSGAKQELLDAVEVEYELLEGDVIVGRGRIRLEGAISGIKGDNGGEAAAVRISSLYPNPTGDAVTIGITASAPLSNATILLYDPLGRLVGTLLEDATLPAGTTAVPVSVGHLPSGTYTVVLRSSAGTAARQMVIAR
jgi:uncharacterized repeat protein (TIGR01451 family)